MSHSSTNILTSPASSEDERLKTKAEEITLVKDIISNTVADEKELAEDCLLHYHKFGESLTSLRMTDIRKEEGVAKRYPPHSPLFNEHPDDAYAAEILAFLHSSPSHTSISEEGKNNMFANSPKRGRDSSSTKKAASLKYSSPVKKRRTAAMVWYKEVDKDVCDQLIDICLKAYRRVHSIKNLREKLDISEDCLNIMLNILSELNLIRLKDGGDKVEWKGSGKSKVYDILSRYDPSSIIGIDNIISDIGLNCTETILANLLCLILEDAETPLSVETVESTILCSYGDDQTSEEQHAELYIATHLLESLNLLKCDGIFYIWVAGSIANKSINMFATGSSSRSSSSSSSSKLKFKSMKSTRAYRPSSRSGSSSSRSSSSNMTLDSSPLLTPSLMNHNSSSFPSSSSIKHRASCHRCGNMRKNIVKCPDCPQIYCKVCADMMVEEHGSDAFVKGCPKCKALCCCGRNKNSSCDRTYHCYRKCPSTKPRRIYNTVKKTYFAATSRRTRRQSESSMGSSSSSSEDGNSSVEKFSPPVASSPALTATATEQQQVSVTVDLIAPGGEM